MTLRSADLAGRVFLHRQRVPLDQVQLAGAADSFSDDCAGVCGV